MEQQSLIAQLTGLKAEFNTLAQAARVFESGFVQIKDDLPVYALSKKKEVKGKLEQVQREAASFEEHAEEVEIVLERLGKLATMPEGDEKDILASDVNISLLLLEHGLTQQAAVSDEAAAATYRAFAKKVHEIKAGF